MAGTPVLEVRLRKADEGIVRSVEALEQVSGVSLGGEPGRMVVSLSDVEEATPLVVRSVVEAGGMVLSVNVVEPSLEEAYLKLVGGED
jgi:hypothetical protein